MCMPVCVCVCEWKRAVRRCLTARTSVTEWLGFAPEESCRSTVAQRAAAHAAWWADFTECEKKERCENQKTMQWKKEEKQMTSCSPVYCLRKIKSLRNISKHKMTKLYIQPSQPAAMFVLFQSIFWRFQVPTKYMIGRKNRIKWIQKKEEETGTVTIKAEWKCCQQCRKRTGERQKSVKNIKMRLTTVLSAGQAASGQQSYLT